LKVESEVIRLLEEHEEEEDEEDDEEMALIAAEAVSEVNSLLKLRAARLSI